MMMVKHGYSIFIYVGLIFTHLCISQTECIPIHTFSQESVTSQTQATNGLHENSRQQETNVQDRVTTRSNIERQVIEKINKEMERRLGIPSLTNIRSNNGGETYMSEYIQNLYEQMLRLYDFNESKRTNGVTKTSEKTAIPSVHIYKPVSDDEENFSFFFNLSKFAGSNITSSQLILENVTASTNANVTFTAAGNFTGTQLTLNANGTGNTAIVDISHVILNQENVSLQIHSSTHASINPAIALFVNVDAQDLAAHNQRSKRDTDTFYESLNKYGTNVNRSESTVSSAESLNICRVKPWVLNFSDIGWNNITPKSYRADLCVGMCPAVFIESYLNTTNFAFVKNLYHVSTDFIHRNNVPEACCTPTLYTSLTILYQDDSEVILKTLPELRVVACGCR